MSSTIHKFSNPKDYKLSIRDTFFILICLQKIASNVNNQFSDNLCYRADKLIDKILINIELEK
tara:strand:- start:562 stop:750 length:189 start_codon:yes stop_codon:yes gene_type:complete